MATISQAPATLDLVAVKADDFTVTLTVTENSVAYDWTGATVATSIIDSSGTEVATDFTVTTSAGGILTLALTDANTTTLGVATYRWQVNVTKASATRTWLAGALSIMQPGWGGSSSSSASLSITAASLALSLTGGAQGQWDTAQTFNAQTGTTYSLVASDAGKMVTLTNASAITLTVPSGLGLSTGQRIDLAQLGAGQVTVAASGTTVNATPGLKLRAQYSAASLIVTGTNTFLLVGDLSA
jgi:hypothetical protein